MAYCYLIHLERAVGEGHRRHYIGFTSDLKRRIEEHRGRDGKGAAMLRSANNHGVPWRVVRVWKDANHEAEKLLKAMGAKNLCPVCNPVVARKIHASRARDAHVS